jgi:hypothetical protein
MTRLLFAALLTAFAGAAVAQTVTVTKDTGETETVQTTVAETTQAETAKPQSARNCLRSTGSRVAAAQNARAEKDGKSQRCASGPGKVYTRDDLERTGYVDLTDALRSLDTSLR